MEFVCQNNREPMSPQSLELYGVPREMEQTLGRVALELETVWGQYLPDRQDWIRRRYERVREYLQAFDGGALPGVVYDILYLYEVTSALDLQAGGDETKADARCDIVAEFLTHPSTSQADFRATLVVLNELKYMDQEANQYRANPEIYKTDQSQTPRLVEAITNEYIGEIMPAEWLTCGEEINDERMKQVLKNAHALTVIVKSVQLLDDLLKSEEHSDVELFHKVNEAEYFYAPFAEFIGFDGLALALGDKAQQIRLMKSGEPKALDALDRGWKIYEQIKDFDVKHILSMIKPANEYTVEQVAGRLSDGQQLANVGDFVVNLSHDIGSVFGSYRFKGPGKIAEKILRKEAYELERPLDLIGMVFEAEDDQQLAKAYGCVIDNLINKVDFKSTPNKDSAFFIKASADKVGMLAKEVTKRGLVADCRAVDDEEFQVAKITFVLKGRPGVTTEIQFMTKKNRKEARIGSYSHSHYKTGSSMSAEAIEVMAEVNASRDSMKNAEGEMMVRPELYERALQSLGNKLVK